MARASPIQFFYFLAIQQVGGFYDIMTKNNSCVDNTVISDPSLPTLGNYNVVLLKTFTQLLFKRITLTLFQMLIACLLLNSHSILSSVLAPYLTIPYDIPYLILLFTLPCLIILLTLPYLIIFLTVPYLMIFLTLPYLMILHTLYYLTYHTL